MPLSETTAKSILRKQKQVDSWFCSSYAMNLYRGCAHNCAYCDGRSEGYYAPENFGSDIEVKVNAPEILKRELDPARKRKPMRPGFVLLGGGVNDCYQPAEKKYLLAREALEIIRDFGHPVHVLTKSTLALRDLELLGDINRQSKAVFSVSISTADDGTAAYFEPSASPPSARLDMVKRAKGAGLACGVYLLPVIPFITDTPEMIGRSFRAVRDAGADFIIFGGMTLKEGRQREHFTRALAAYEGAGHAEGALSHQYDILYRGDKWGNPVSEYSAMLHELLFAAAGRFGIPVRMPPSIFGPVLDMNGRVQVILEHMDYIRRNRGLKSTFGYAARGIAKLEGPVTVMRKRLREISGIGPSTELLVREIIDTGTSLQYEKMIRLQR
jgi:DNA repair photolyase